MFSDDLEYHQNRGLDERLMASASATPRVAAIHLALR